MKNEVIALSPVVNSLTGLVEKREPGMLVPLIEELKGLTSRQQMGVFKEAIDVVLGLGIDTEVRRGVKRLMEVDEQLGGRFDGEKTEREIRYSAPHRIMTIYKFLSEAEGEDDRRRFEIMQRVMTGEMGVKLMMVDAEWAPKGRLVTYIKQCINRSYRFAGGKFRDIWQTEKSGGSLIFDQLERLNELLGICADRTVDFCDGGDDDSQLCEAIWKELNVSDKRFIGRMIEEEWNGAEAFVEEATNQEYELDEEYLKGGEED